jgi:hypothetical protein
MIISDCFGRGQSAALWIIRPNLKAKHSLT